MLKLIYGCLAFSLIACVLLFVAAAQEGEGFHGMTKSMGDALADGATVLAATRDGAVTQTGNGKVSGFMRNGSEVWSTKYNRFAESPRNPYGAGANDATAWCEGDCPSTLVEFDGNFEVFGGASESLPQGLNPLRTKPEDVLAIGQMATALIRVFAEGSSQPRLFSVAPQRQPRALGAINPSGIQPVQPRFHAVVGSAKGKVGFLNQLVFSDNDWNIAGRSLREAELKNVCVSDTETWVGSVSTRIRRFEFGDAPGPAIGPVVTGGTCTVDDLGITAVFTPKSAPTAVVAARFARSGRMLWNHNFGAQRLLSDAGSSYVVAQSQDGTVTAVDSVSGRVAYRAKVVGAPFVGPDGSIVTANRKGKPQWLLNGGGDGRQ